MIPHVSSATEWIRWAAFVLGCILLGTNFGFVAKAHRVFTRKTAFFWRLFFAGKSLITMTTLIWLWHADGPIKWYGTPMLGAGYFIALVALAYANHYDIFMGTPLARVRPSKTEITLVEGREVDS